LARRALAAGCDRDVADRPSAHKTDQRPRAHRAAGRPGRRLDADRVRPLLDRRPPRDAGPPARKQTLAQQEYQRYERIRSDAPAEPRASQPDSRPAAPAAREANGAVDELTSVDLSGTGATLPPAAVSSLFTNRTA